MPTARRVARHSSRQEVLNIAFVGVLLYLAIIYVAADLRGIPLTLVIVSAVLVQLETNGVSAGCLLAASTWLWIGSGISATSWWVVPAALALLITAAAQMFVASAPPAVPVTRPMVLRWLRRTAIVAVITAAVGSGAVVMAQAPEPQGSTWWLVAALGALIVAAVAVVFTHAGEPDGE